MSISHYDFAVESVISKLKKIKDGRLQVCNIENPLEKIQFNMLKSLVSLELYLEEHPHLAVEDEPIERYLMSFEVSSVDTVFPVGVLRDEINGT